MSRSKCLPAGRLPGSEGERRVRLEEKQDRGKVALTELFQEVKSDKTPFKVEGIVNDIEQIVRSVCFARWQEGAARSHAQI